MLKVRAYHTDQGRKTYMGDFNFNIEPEPGVVKANKPQTGSLYSLKKRDSFRNADGDGNEKGYMVFTAE